MKIAIIGSGNVGLITGACFSDVGNKVICYDIDTDKIKNLNEGKVDVYESGLDRLINKNLNSNLFFSDDIKHVVKESDIIFLTVGTPMGQRGKTNMEYMYSAAKDIGTCLESSKLIITKSTIPVGETYKVGQIILKHAMRHSTGNNVEFDIANNPEFLKEGKGISDFMSPDRIVVGIDNPKLKEVFSNLYRPFSINHEKLIFMDVLSSELTKYAANAMLATRISFMNELSILAEKSGADINNVRKGIGSDERIGYDYIYPSVGYGGSCFAKDLNSIIDFSEKLNCDLRIIKSVEKANLKQRDYFLNKIIERFGGKSAIKGKVFSIWGLSFKPGTNDIRGAISIYIIDKILRLGGSLHLYDPKASENVKNLFNDARDPKAPDARGITFFDDKYEVVKSTEALILLTEWPEFRSPNFKLLKTNLKQPLIFDGKNQFDKYHMKDIGFEYHQIGVPLFK